MVSAKRHDNNTYAFFGAPQIVPMEIDQRPIRPQDNVRLPLNPSLEDELQFRLKRFIRKPDFPCVGAKSALQASRLQVMIGGDVTLSLDDLLIYPSLLSSHEDTKLRHYYFRASQ